MTTTIRRTPSPARSGQLLTGAVRRAVRDHQLIAFAVLSLVLSWIPWALEGFTGGGLNPTGPAIAALIVAGVSGGGQLRRLGQKLTDVRTGWRWLLAAVAVPIGAVMAAVGVNTLLGAPAPTVAQLGTWTALPLELLIVFIFIGLGEEIGWTAFAAPRVLARWHLPMAVAALATLRVLWHLPLFLDGQQPWIIALVIIAFQFLVLWAYRRTGQWAYAAVFHTVQNIIGGAYFFQFVDGSDNVRLSTLLTVNMVVLTLGVIAVDRIRMTRAIAEESRPLRLSPAGTRSSEESPA